MDIKVMPMGEYATNCYIVSKNNKELIIDPGVGAYKWVKENVKNPVAILNTHGHFDHIWSNDELAKEFGIPIYCPKDDVFMLSDDIFGYNIPPSKADVEVKHDEQIDFGFLHVRFWHFPGHTPGCSAIEIEDALFSGDFIFKGSIGRVDFPFSNAEDMKKSIKKVLSFEKNLHVYPGHGESTTLEVEKQKLPAWLRFI
ncbi:MAG: MBL fold metallo-hydrolase [Campylobacteraceae bacterium]|nr:MBL fold metallo-hydrolase [Campylobacteraceae bacterium]